MRTLGAHEEYGSAVRGGGARLAIIARLSNRLIATRIYTISQGNLLNWIITYPNIARAFHEV